MSHEHEDQQTGAEENHSEIKIEVNGVKVVIDLEDVFHGRDCHREADPGEVIYHRFKIDGEVHDVKERHLIGQQLLKLAGKTPEQAQLFQSRKEGQREKELVLIKPEEEVDLKKPGIEMFITKPHPPRVYHFSVSHKEYTTEKAKLTVKEILVDFAKVDPVNKILAEKLEQNNVREYTNLDEVIGLERNPKFILYDVTPTPVS
jgi:Multiubiquitin